VEALEKHIVERRMVQVWAPAVFVVLVVVAAVIEMVELAVETVRW
jgi:hypothetical protein